MSATKEETPAWLNDNVESLAKNVASSPAAQEFAVTSAINSLSSPGGFSKLASAITGMSQSQFQKLDTESSHGGEAQGKGSGPLEGIACDAAELKEIEMWADRLRKYYLIISVMMFLAAFFSLGSNSLVVVFIALYVWFFSILLFCFELSLSAFTKLISENFGFLYSPIMRSVFHFLLMLLSFELGFIGKLACIGLAVSGIMYVYVVVKHPMYEDVLRRKHYYKVPPSDGAASSSAV